MQKTKVHEKVSVTKTFSMPLDLLNTITEEAQIMGKTVSEATQTLVRLGISIRRDQRRREEEQLSDAEKKILGG